MRACVRALHACVTAWVPLRSAQRFQGFVACIIGGTSLMAVALFLFLPVVLLFPAKFALTFTLGSFLIQAAFALLRGPAKHVRGMFTRDRVAGTLLYLASMGASAITRLPWGVGGGTACMRVRPGRPHTSACQPRNPPPPRAAAGLTLYAAIIARSYILVMLAVAAQVATLLWSSVSYLPRGQAALSVFTTLFCKAARLMCYPCQAALRRLVFYCMGYKPGAGI